jgi:hypothetical protein
MAGVIGMVRRMARSIIIGAEPDGADACSGGDCTADEQAAAKTRRTVT